MIKKIIKYMLIILIIIIIVIIYREKYRDINLLNINCGLNLPKPKIVRTILDEDNRDGDIFQIFNYNVENVDSIKKQINKISNAEINQEELIEIKNLFNELLENKVLTKIFERDLIEKYLDLLGRENVYYTYLQKKTRVILIIFDEKNLELYYFNCFYIN